ILGGLGSHPVPAIGCLAKLLLWPHSRIARRSLTSPLHFRFESTPLSARRPPSPIEFSLLWISPSFYSWFLNQKSLSFRPEPERTRRRSGGTCFSLLSAQSQLSYIHIRHYLD